MGRLQCFVHYFCCTLESAQKDLTRRQHLQGLQAAIFGAEAVKTMQGPETWKMWARLVAGDDHHEPECALANYVCEVGPCAN